MEGNGPKHWSECTSEAEEARWWDEHPDYVEKLFEKAAAKGEVAIRRKGISVHDSAPTRSLMVALSADEREKLHNIAQQRGLDDAEYARELLVEALREAQP
jgi:hypothetical protein